jgi:hypothetical protein
MQLLELIKQWMDTGVIPSISAILGAIVLVIIEVAKNKLAKRLAETQSANSDLKNEVSDLKEEVKVLKTIINNVDVVTSSAVDMLHVAFANSKLNADTRLQLQKLYDSCPDSMAKNFAPKLAAIIESEATPEQIAAVAANTSESYIDTIAKKINC